MSFRSTKSLKLREVNDGVEPRSCFLGRQTDHLRVEHHVVPGGQLLLKADAELDHRCDAGSDPNPPGIRLVDAREELQQRALPGPVSPDDAEELTAPDIERDLVENLQPSRLRCARSTQDATLEVFSWCPGMLNDLERPRTSIAKSPCPCGT